MDVFARAQGCICPHPSMLEYLMPQWKKHGVSIKEGKAKYDENKEEWI